MINKKEKAPLNLTYDDLDRLISTRGNAGIGSSHISYDGLGNITAYSNNSVGKVTDLTYQYNPNHRLTGITGAGSAGYNSSHTSGHHRSYDKRGNVTHNGRRGFTYNLANQMTGSNGNRYLYDGFNRRVKTMESKGTSYSQL